MVENKRQEAEDFNLAYDKYHKDIQAAPGAWVQIGIDNRILDVSSGFLTLFGYKAIDRDNFIGDKYMAFVKGDLQETYKKYHGQEKIGPIEERVRHDSGRWVPVIFEGKLDLETKILTGRVMKKFPVSVKREQAPVPNDLER